MSNSCVYSLKIFFELLDQEGIDYCVMRGYDGHPDFVGNDVDIVIAKATEVTEIAKILRLNHNRLKARIVRRIGCYLILLCEQEFLIPQFLILDFSTAFEVEGSVFMTSNAILESRIRTGNFWIPSPGHQFNCTLAHAIAKEELDCEKVARLTALYQENPDLCDLELGKIWPADSLKLITGVAAKGNWETMRPVLNSLKNQLRKHLTRERRFKKIKQLSNTFTARVNRFLHPQGFHLVLLGPDGAGKSSVIDALEKSMVGPFARVQTLGFAPPLYKLWRRGPTKTDTPHAAATRSYLVSTLRALFWLAYGLTTHLTFRIAKARSTIILNDRHFVDILVDPVRYRYGGPTWLLHLIWKVSPKPDAIVLLYGPAEILQARKRELSIAETERQCHDYLILIKAQKCGHVVNAAQPFEGVMKDICNIIFPPFDS